MFSLNPLIQIFITSDVLDLADGYNRQSAKKKTSPNLTFAVRSYPCCDIHESTSWQLLHVYSCRQISEPQVLHIEPLKGSWLHRSHGKQFWIKKPDQSYICIYVLFYNIFENYPLNMREEYCLSYKQTLSLIGEHSWDICMSIHFH